MSESDRAGSEDPNGGGIDSAREELLEESRRTLARQLGQIDKIDDAAVRTVRISLVVLGILAGGSRFASFPDLGVPGYLGTAALVSTLVGSVTVYGTSRVFIGTAPDELTVRYTERPVVENTYVEFLSEYERGLSDNRLTLLANGFILVVARTLLVVSIVLLLYAFVTAGAAASPGTSDPATLEPALMVLRAESEHMSDSESGDRSEGLVRPVSIYTGPKTVADAKVALGEWLEERGS